MREATNVCKEDGHLLDFASKSLSLQYFVEQFRANKLAKRIADMPALAERLGHVIKPVRKVAEVTRSFLGNSIIEIASGDFRCPFRLACHPTQHCSSGHSAENRTADQGQQGNQNRQAKVLSGTWMKRH